MWIYGMPHEAWIITAVCILLKNEIWKKSRESELLNALKMFIALKNSKKSDCGEHFEFLYHLMISYIRFRHSEEWFRKLTNLFVWTTQDMGILCRVTLGNQQKSSKIYVFGNFLKNWIEFLTHCVKKKYFFNFSWAILLS